MNIKRAAIVLVLLNLASGCKDPSIHQDTVVSITDAQGRKFIFLKNFSLQGRAVGLGLYDGNGKVQVLGMPGAEWYGTPPPLIRPSNPAAGTEGGEALYICPDETVVGSFGDLMFSYNPNTKIFRNVSELYEQSPFSCLASNDSLDLKDINSWNAALSSTQKERHWKIESIRQGLTHPNDEVRALTKKWLSKAKYLPGRR